MLIIENIIVAIQSLRMNKLRSFLTLVGIAVGIGAVLYVVVLGEMTQQSIKKRLESLGSNVLLVRPGFSHRHGVRTTSNVINLKLSDAEEILTSSKVITRVVPTSGGSGNMVYRDKNWNTRVTGTSPEYAVINNEQVISGRFFSLDEVDRRARVCVLGATVHEKLFGDESPVGESVLVNSKRFEVIGLLAAKGESWSSPDDQIFIPLTTAQERLYGTDYLSSILAQMRSEKDYDEALFDIEMILRRNHRLRDDQENDFQVRRQDMYLATIQDTTREIADFIIMIALISLIVGGIGIANVMLVSVTERTREIGVRRAVGANRLVIMVQFIIEAAMLGITGGIIGIVGGSLFNQLTIGAGLILPWTWILYSFMICGGIGVLAGIYPAFRAANANVIESLRYE